MTEHAPTIKILLVGHEASRTGAPIILLQLLRWLQERGNFQCDVLLVRGGALLSEYQKLARTTVVEEGWLRKGAIVGRILRKFRLGGLCEALRRFRTRRLLGERRRDIVYCNTLDCADALDHLAPLEVPMICHVHELEFVVRSFVGLERARRMVEQATRFIACASCVATYLREQQGISAGRITTVHEFVPISGEEYGMKERHSADSALSVLGITSDTVVVASCGSLIWRKGADLFLHLALQVHAALPERDVRFIWIGGYSTPDAAPPEFEHDLRAAKLEGRVIVLGEQANPAPFLARSDVFVLCSREDPFPLVCLESANLAKPIVCFRDAGGMPEFVEDDCGFSVPYLDIPAMAAAVTRLVTDMPLRLKLGGQARAKVAARHSLEAGVKAIENIILEEVAGPVK